MAAAWESQWQEHLLQRAMSRAQEKVSLRNLQIFQMATVHGWSAEEISAALGVNRAQIYVAKHRVGRLVAKEIRALRSELE
jgi:RNA polymerase sigma-70 factor (ECF subfamily)